MIRINSNFYGQKKRGYLFLTEWGKFENMKHIYECQKLNWNTKTCLQYEKIYNGNLAEKVQIYKQMKENIEMRTLYENMKVKGISEWSLLILC